MLTRTLAIAAVALTALLPAAAAAAGSAPAGEDVYLVAGLRGANEVGAPGDPDGLSTVALKISGNEVSFAIRWDKVDVPKAAHLHLGARGTDGAIQLDLIDGRLPKTALGVAGTTKADPAVVAALVADPSGFYADLHNDAFENGAVRGQFHRLNRKIDLRGVLHGADQATISSANDGWWLRPASAAAMAYTATWSGILPPVSGGIERGSVAAELFEDPDGLQPNLTGIAGEAPVDRTLLRDILAAPQTFAGVLRSLEGGVVSERLSPKAPVHPRALTADVLLGAQIYACTQQGATTAFTQFDVSAQLRRGISHSFVQPVAGPPQWVAPDHSAVRGTVVTRTPNGAGNIPELVLDATQAGAGTGLLAQATQILRLNTKGGVAPAGACTPGEKASVRYGADYLFLG
ncbi:CHRD domain-containing protein [Nonomuraea zeae]|uniref:DUF3455 domain-containing protein n=1 Tax=Nonomuraea zeae TaxID=1642303 RepID=A0A5S4GXL4_9ACTN|nr:CHRD domain-containing protein [Nonomuraea zeae]TMR31230.1 DUF3455 domain-containing protein [Nonomuraea zeae]